MATTVGNFSAIDDTEVDAESPITETLVTRLRDNSYWIDPATTRTTATSNTLVLTPNQTAGTTQWQEVGDIAGVDGTKGSGTASVLIGTPTQVAIVTGKKIHITFSDATDTGVVIVDASDDTYVATGSNNGSGTLTGSFVNIVGINGSVNWRKNGSNYEFYCGNALNFAYIWL